MVVGVTAALVPFGEDIPRAVPALLLLAPVIAAALLSGRLVAAAVALEAGLAFAAGFLPPIGSPAVELGQDAIALAIFVVVATALGTIISAVVTSERLQVESLKQADAQRSALLRSVSHDLRTPLASIHGVVTDLQADTPFDPATRHELLSIVASECERLDRLVSNLLSMSRIEAGAFLPDRDMVDVSELVHASVERLRSALTTVEVVLVLPEGLPTVVGDFTQLDQVVTNLIENAARHSPPGGRITVEVATIGDALTLTVSDEGDGIDPAIAESVFEPFRTGSGETSTGIGLAICRSIVNAHGGTIEVDDNPDGGACFAVRIPTHEDWASDFRAGDRR